MVRAATAQDPPAAENLDGAARELALTTLSDAPSWWAEAGAPGWNPAAWLGPNAPWVLAGHALGGWRLVEPGRAPTVQSAPGVLAMQTPLVWYDDLSMTLGSDAPWRGYGAGLAVATAEGRVRRGARTLVDLRNGDFGFDENSLSISRSDSLRWLRVEAADASREPVGGLGRVGRHLWSVGLGVERGRHGVEAIYSQRGASMTLAAEEEQAASAESGSLDYRWRGTATTFGIRLERIRQRHESLGALFAAVREAGETGAAVELLRTDGSLELRADFRRVHVAREALEVESVGFDRLAHVWWGAGRYERRLWGGRARATLGAGHHEALDRFDIAPTLEYRFLAGPLSARVGFERVLEPVWTDVLAASSPFMQDTWAGVLGAEAGQPGKRRASATVLFGRTRDRALIARIPMEEIWLRLGPEPDPLSYEFALVTVSGVWPLRRFTIGGNGYVLARNQSSAQPFVDPGVGARSFVEWTHQAFGGNLGMMLRGEVEGVGARESQGGIPDMCGDPETVPPRMLPGYVTLGATAGFTLARALISIRVRNLEGRVQEQPWVDCTSLEEALGPGREWRFAVTARLSN